MEQRKESTSPCATTPEEGCTDRTGAGRTGLNWVGSGENEEKKGLASCLCGFSSVSASGGEQQ